jgi:hypothetical protein
MKKVFLAFIAVLGFVLTSSAQQGTTKTTKTAKTETKTVLKKDGTPDKRYKQAEKPKPVLKKDGTPDKRYKANK